MRLSVDYLSDIRSRDGINYSISLLWRRVSDSCDRRMGRSNLSRSFNVILQRSLEFAISYYSKSFELVADETIVGKALSFDNGCYGHEYQELGYRMLLRSGHHLVCRTKATFHKE